MKKKFIYKIYKFYYYKEGKREVLGVDANSEHRTHTHT